jgi:DNA-directed RNA polymerase specialized sigma24 family protein
MFGLSKTPNQSEVYATSADFCRIFERDMNRLYMLSLLLTGSEESAEKCFVQGLDSSKSGNPVFREWAESWARRTIVQNAIQMVQPHPTDVLPTRSVADDDLRTKPAAVAAVLALPAFDRFAYVLSVLEGYPLHECALLLDCSRSEVITARMRALQEVVKSVETTRAGTKTLVEVGRGLEKFPQLAATA